MSMCKATTMERDYLRLVVAILFVLLKSIDAVQYNQICTFSSSTCQWSIGRRWHVVNLNVDNQSTVDLSLDETVHWPRRSLVLVADSESEDDQRIGFTDALMSSWLHLSSLCSFDIRLTFQFSIPNPNDFIEVYLINENRSRLALLGQWKGLAEKRLNISDETEATWQQANITFKAIETFRIDIEVRHLPDYRTHPIAWFAIDNLLIESCPTGTSATVETSSIPVITSSSSSSSIAVTESSPTNLNQSDAFSSFSFVSRSNLVTLILYLLCTLIALTLLIILLMILVYTYRRHCCFYRPEQISTANNRIGIQIEHHRIHKGIETSVRPCF